MMIEITKTAVEKVKILKNLNKTASEKLIKRAYLWGTNYRDLPAKEKVFYERRINTDDYEFYIFAGCCFIFAGCYCINVIRNPFKDGCTNCYVGKTKIKRPKRYYRHNISFLENDRLMTT